MVEEIRLHGQGGQGVVAAGELIAIAASYEGKFCRAFPMYGSARRGAPVLAFAQIGEESEATRSMIYHPNYLMLLDPPMPEIMDVTTGLRDGGTIIYNTTKRADEAAKLFSKVKLGKLAVLDATGIAQRTIGRPIPNTVMLGAFARATGLLRMESIDKALDKRFPPKLAESNKGAAKMGYETVEVKTF
jgi:2-oxoacid:acceptor oxidoreductase gamma subunit (pyruvate/2-ketoisovalerate family)